MMNDMKPKNGLEPSKRPAIKDKPGAIPVPKNENTSNKTIEIRLHLPHIKRVPLVGSLAKRLRETSRKQRLILIVALVLIVAAGLLTTQRLQQSGRMAAATTTPPNPLDQLQKGTPDYPTLLPEGKSANDLGGWTRISPPEREPVYAYVDTIASVPVSVSQQPLPPTFKSDPDKKVRDLAMAQNADKSLSAGSIKLYIGTSKNGPQSVIFNTDALLVLIKSSAAVPDDEWKKYVESLR